MDKETTGMSDNRRKKTNQNEIKLAKWQLLLCASSVRVQLSFKQWRKVVTPALIVMIMVVMMIIMMG